MGVAVTVIAAACLTVPSIRYKPGSTTASPAAILEFEQRTVDLGDLPVSQAPHVVRFPFVNRGTAPLEIREIISGCGCAGASVTQSPILPGHSGELVVRLRSTQAETKTVPLTVVSNDAREAETSLSVKWRSTLPISLAAQRIDFAPVHVGTTVTRRIPIVRTPAGMNLPIEHVEVTNPSQMSAVYIAREGDPGEETVDVSVHPTDLQASQIGGVKVTLGGDGGGVITLPVRWSVVTDFEVTPAAVFLGIVPQNEVIDRRVFIRSASDETVQVALRQEQRLPSWIDIQEQNRSDSEVEWKIHVVVPDASGPFRTEVLFDVSTGANRQTVRIPCSGIASLQ